MAGLLGSRHPFPLAVPLVFERFVRFTPLTQKDQEGGIPRATVSDKSRPDLLKATQVSRSADAASPGQAAVTRIAAPGCRWVSG